MTGSQSELLQEIALEAVFPEKQDQIRPKIEALKQERGPAVLTAALQAEVVRSADAVSVRSAQYGGAYRRWLVYLAEPKAEGSKEGGFLGINPVRVSEEESAMLAQLRSALGVPAPGASLPRKHRAPPNPTGAPSPDDGGPRGEGPLGGGRAPGRLLPLGPGRL